MKTDPVIANQFAENVVFSELGAWLGDQAKQSTPHQPSDKQTTLFPKIQIGGMSSIGLSEKTIPNLSLKPLRGKGRSSLRLWIDRSADLSSSTLQRLLEKIPRSPYPLLFTCSGNSDGLSYRLIHSQKHSTQLIHTIEGLVPDLETKLESNEELRSEFDARMKGRLRYTTTQTPTPFWSLCSHQTESLRFVLHALLAIPTTAFGVTQVLFAPLPKEWERAFGALSRVEKIAASRRIETDRWTLSQEESKSWESQVPGGLFCAAPRAALFLPNGTRTAVFPTIESYLSGIYTPQRSVEHANTKTLRDRGFRAPWLKRSLQSGLAAEGGILLDSKSLASLLPLPDSELLSSKEGQFDIRPRWKPVSSKQSGPEILSECRYNTRTPIDWPKNLRTHHMIVSGVPGKGKSTFLAKLGSAIGDLEPNEGFSLIDPHDTTIDLLVQCLPEPRISDCILHDPTDKDYVLCLPLFDCSDVDQIDLATSSVTHQICSLFAKTDLGFNIVHGIKNTVRTILLSPELSLLDMRKLLEKSNAGEELREKICVTLDDEVLQDYWDQDFETLDRGTIGRIRARFEHILESRLLRPLLANKIRKLSYSEIIDNNLIFLAKTSPAKAGANLASILGTLHSTGFQSAGFSRNLDGTAPRIFTLIADEFGNYSNPRTIAHALRTLRKFNVSLVLAAQNIQALPPEVVQATSNIETHVVFQQGWDDAQHYYKAFSGQISNEELLHQPVGRGFARFGEQLAEIEAPFPEQVRGAEILNEIMADTRARYCIPRTELLEQLSDEEKVPMADLDKLDLI